jgi:pimeloyl-ACP methyl ester carboxylesterase
MHHNVRGSGPAILFVHGIPTSGRLWDLVVGGLAERFTCITVDLPGFGESPRPRPEDRDPGQLAEQLEALREELAVPRWHVVGHDAGATIAVHYAAAHADRVARLVLMSPPVFPEFQPPWFFRLLRLPVAGDLIAPFLAFGIWHGGIQALMERPSPVTAEAIAAFQRPFSGLAGGRRLSWLVRWGDPAEVLGRTAALLPRISASTLILHGRQDGAIPQSFAERAAAAIPQARVRFFDSGHFLPLNVPEEINLELAEFLRADPRD